MFTLRKQRCDRWRWQHPCRGRGGRPGETSSSSTGVLCAAGNAALILSALILISLPSSAPAFAQHGFAAGKAMGDSAAGSSLILIAEEKRTKDEESKSDNDKAESEYKQECGRGRYLSDGHCCARGTAWNGKRCLRRAGLRPTCPSGTRGIYPDCQGRSGATCPTGTTGSYPNCRTIQTCPSGMVGAPPNCRTITVERPASRTCPPGFSGVPPVCRPLGNRPCPAGTVRSGARCITLQPQRPVPRPNLNLGAPRPALPTPQVGSGATQRPLWR